MTAYYNEIDPKAAAWLRELIKQGHIAPGEVDERSIVDVKPADLHGFTQCHFFAGIGVWSHALRKSGWSDNEPVWTGSCPCQPFSSAGKGSGFDDERHLWPAFHWLIEQCRPTVVFGEQVASKDADPWIDLVQSDMEAMGYAFGAIPFPSAGVGAPHIRDRLYWLADSNNDRQRPMPESDLHNSEHHVESRFGLSRMGYANQSGLEGQWVGHQTTLGYGEGEAGSVTTSGELGGMGNSVSSGRQSQSKVIREHENGVGETGRQSVPGVEASSHVPDGMPAASPTNGFWRDADWLHCRDGKWRPVEPGTFPLAHGAPERVGRLRGYGNAINAEAATVFIEAYLESK